MDNEEILHTLNCIILEQEDIKIYIKELENRIKELENDNEQRQILLRKEVKNT